LRVTLIHNPSAGDEGHERTELVAVLEAAGHEVDYRSTADSGKQVLGRRSELVAVAGGDGTVAAAFEEFAGSATPVAVIPLGTANNIAGTLGLSGREPEQLVAAWPECVLLPFDVCEVGEPWQRFVESAGGGLLAELFARADEESGDKVEHGLEVLRNVLAEAPVAHWDLDLDGTNVSRELLGVAAMNVREIGPEIMLAPAANPCDGLLDVVLLTEEDREPLRAYVEERLGGRTAATPPLASRRGRELTVQPPRGTALHVDDEPWPGDENGRIVVRAGELQVNVLVPDTLVLEAAGRPPE
jgi:diacylglycerol kinase (ATP)